MDTSLPSPSHPLHYLKEKDSFHMTRGDARSVWLDYHLADRYAGELPSQKKIVEDSRQNDLPEIQVGPFEGHLLSMFLIMIGAKRGVEIGTLGGYSASWICRALEKQPRSEVHLDCLELNPKFAAVAEKNLEPWKGLFTMRVGSAMETLEGSLSDLKNLDFVFIDADKAAYPRYFDWAWPRLRKGGVVLLDNFYLRGSIYFGKTGEYPPEVTGQTRDWEEFSKTQRSSMKLLWDRLETLGDAEKTIVPTSEGLGLILKL